MNNNDLKLLQMCNDCGIFTSECASNIIELDLLESGMIDSMSLTMMAAMINKNYGIEINLQLFVAELRNLKLISAYLEQNRPACVVDLK